MRDDRFNRRAYKEFSVKVKFTCFGIFTEVYRHGTVPRSAPVAGWISFDMASLETHNDPKEVITRNASIGFGNAPGSTFAGSVKHPELLITYYFQPSWHYV